MSSSPWWCVMASVATDARPRGIPPHLESRHWLLETGELRACTSCLLFPGRLGASPYQPAKHGLASGSEVAFTRPSMFSQTFQTHTSTPSRSPRAVLV